MRREILKLPLCASKGTGGPFGGVPSRGTSRQEDIRNKEGESHV